MYHRDHLAIILTEGSDLEPSKTAISLIHGVGQIVVLSEKRGHLMAKIDETDAEGIRYRISVLPCVKSADFPAMRLPQAN